jgi:hypothetical protein
LEVVTVGDTLFTPGILAIKFTNSSSIKSFVDHHHCIVPTCELFDLPGDTVIRLAHILLNLSTIEAEVPSQIASIVIILKTQIIIPSILKADLSLLLRSAVIADDKYSENAINN